MLVVPAIRKWILDHPSIWDREITFEFLSTSGFTDDAIELLEKRKNNTQNYRIDYF